MIISRINVRCTMPVAMVLVLLLSACSVDSNGPGDDENPDLVQGGITAGVDIDGDMQRNLGIVTQQLGASTFQAVEEGPAHVLNALPVIQALAALNSAQAAAVSSDSARDRAEQLFNADAAGSLDVWCASTSIKRNQSKYR